MTGDSEGEKPKVLIFLNRLVIGGPAIDVISMAGFLQNDFEVLVVYGERESHEVEATFLLHQYPNLPTTKMKLLKKSINPIDLFKSITSLFSILREFKPDIIHTHGAIPGVLGRIAAKMCKTKVVVHTFHGHFFHSYFNRFFSSGIIFIERMLSLISDSIIATSNRQMKDLVYKYHVVDLEKVTIIDLGIDEKFLATKTEKREDSFSEKYKIPSDTIAIGIIARIVRVKNFFLFVEIVEKVLEKASHKAVSYTHLTLPTKRIV